MARTGAMRQAWDRRAESDPLYAIEASRADWTEDEFFADGREVVDFVMGLVGDDLARGCMLEIGCGIGRIAIPFSRHFERVDGIDVSPRMIDAACTRRLPANVRLHPSSGEDLASFDDRSLDFVFSLHVFQHIGAPEVIRRYFEEIRRVLRPAGAALLQFDTRRATPAARLQALVPDTLPPAYLRRHMRRYRRDPQWIRTTAANAGLTVQWDRGERTHWHWVMLRPAAA